MSFFRSSAVVEEPSSDVDPAQEEAATSITFEKAFPPLNAFSADVPSENAASVNNSTQNFAATVAQPLWLGGELVTELYDTAVLSGVRQPMAVGFQNNEIERLAVIEDPEHNNAIKEWAANTC